MGVVETAVQPHGEDGAALQKAPEAGAVANPSLVALCTVARFHQIAADVVLLSHQLGLTPSEPVDTATLLRAAKHLGLKAKSSRTTPERLSLTPLPALAVLRNKSEDGSTSERRPKPPAPSSNPWTSSPRTGPANSSSSPAAPASRANSPSSISPGSFPASSSTASCSAKCSSSPSSCSCSRWSARSSSRS
jgi:hypothetical protein